MKQAKSTMKAVAMSFPLLAIPLRVWHLALHTQGHFVECRMPEMNKGL